MVAVLLRLRFRILANTLRRNPVQLIAVIAGAVSTLGFLAAALGGLVIASVGPPAATQTVVVAGGAALVVGWWVVPLLFDGVDRTLDPVKLARFPLRTSQLMVAMFLVGITWVPGFATILVSAGTAIAWHPYPASVVAAIGTGLIGAATCVVGSRLTTSLVGSLLRGRGAVRVLVVALVLIAVVAPIVGVILGGSGRRVSSEFPALIGALGWTPVGAAWSVPGRLAMGDAAGAIGATAIALSTLAALIVLWWLVLRSSLRVRGEGPSRVRAGGRLGPLGWMPPTPTGAVAARSLVYWFRDARLARQLILIPVLPALVLLWWSLLHIDGVAIAIGPVIASLLPLSVFAGLSYDGTAFAAELAAGVRGVEDRLGRAIALLIVAAPAAVIVQLVVAIIIGRVGDLPLLFGLTLGVLLVSVGVVSVSSARVVVPVARAGRNPFSAQAGSATVTIVASYAVTGVTLVLVLPVVAIAVAALLTGLPLLAWLTLLVGLIVGVAVCGGGILLGGRVLDSAGPALLARLRLIRD